MIQEKLANIGLSEKEAEVYVCVAEYTTITPSGIAQKTGISRPTVYAAGKNLAKRGLILEEETPSGVRFSIAPFDAITGILERQQDDLDAQFAIAQSLVKDLESLPKSLGYSVPKVRFINEAHMEEYIYKKAPEWDKTALHRDATWWGVQDSTLVKHLSEWLAWYWKRADKRMCTKIVTNDKEEGYSFTGQENPRREMRYWKGSDKIRTTQMIIGDYILIVNTFKKPYSIFEIYDAVTAEGLRQVFKGLWDEVV
jgi:sugar-specific transcriptional regulator TrmB